MEAEHTKNCTKPEPYRSTRTRGEKIHVNNIQKYAMLEHNQLIPTCTRDQGAFSPEMTITLSHTATSQHTDLLSRLIGKFAIYDRMMMYGIGIILFIIAALHCNEQS